VKFLPQKASAARLGRDRRIRKGDDFAALLKVGARGATALVSVAITPARSRGRLGISASTKVGGSVQRNRARRMVREYYREAHRGSSPYDMVVNLKTGFAELSAAEVRNALDDAVSKAINARKRLGRRAHPVH
jgi:ribonuclease P protein component